ncbi:MAG: hypothetical protein J6J18_04335 [Oscillospiraceae bacterium]|nr:hypothetical protein [Oscillospiraceae bacterium]
MLQMPQNHNRKLWDYHVDVNGSATAAWYASAEPWSCECDHCRNFLKLAGENRLPKPIYAVLKELNIEAEQATYVCEIMPTNDGHLYQFSFRIAGQILNEADAKNTVEDWGEVLCCHEPYPYGAPGFPTPHFDLEFWVPLPWVLDKKQDGGNI